MAITKQSLPINFAQGLDLKADPFQVQPGKFLALSNTVFDKGGRLTKRNGFGLLPTLSDAEAQFLTKFNENLTAVGSRLTTFSEGSQSWLDKGYIQPAKVSVLSVFKSDIGQSQADSVTHTNGLMCTVLTDQQPSGGGVLTPIYKYMISDARTGEQLIPPVAVPTPVGIVAQATKVFVLGNYFIIVATVKDGSASSLRYTAINAYTPTVVLPTTTVSASYQPTADYTSPNFEGAVFNNRLYLAWGGIGNVQAKFLTSDLALSSAATTAGVTADLTTVTVDASVGLVYITAYNAGDQSTTTIQLDDDLSTTGLSPVLLLQEEELSNITSSAQNGALTVFYEKSNFYDYGDQLATSLIKKIGMTQAGAIISGGVVARSVGLASKSFILNGKIYLVGLFVSPFQPTYFLLNDTGGVVAKLAYSNGASDYYMSGLTSATIKDDEVSFVYLVKDRIEAVNKNQSGVVSTAGIYSQTGINRASVIISSADASSAEIGNDLHLSGGILWMYDGFAPVEHGFHLWPENVQAAPGSGGAILPQKYFYSATYEWTDAQGNVFRSAPSVPLEVDMSKRTGGGVSFQAVFTLGDTILTVNSTTGLFVGMPVQDDSQLEAFAAGTKITVVGVGTITVSSAALASSAAAPGDSMSTLTIAAKANFTKNSLSIQVASTAGLQVGQVFIDTTTPGNLDAGTTITAIDQATRTLTVNTPTLGASATDQISTTPASTVMFFTAGSTQIRVRSVAGFYVGQVVNDATVPGAFQASTKITAIDPTGFTITIDKPTLLGCAVSSNRTSAQYPQMYAGPFYYPTYVGAPVAYTALFIVFGPGDVGKSVVVNSANPVPVDVANGYFIPSFAQPPFAPAITGSNAYRDPGVISEIILATPHTLSGVVQTFAASFDTASSVINVSSTAGLAAGQTLVDLTTPGNLPGGVTIIAVNATANTVVISAPTTGATVPEIIQTSNIYANTINIPTLRLTYKTTNQVRIAIYRWSTAQQTYYQVTPVIDSLLNNTSIDSVTFVDTRADADILGNNILYTTGGVVENIAAPPTNIMTLYRSRLFLVDAEDPNRLWYSKQVVESTPVDMSDLFTVYVAPTTAAQGNTGDIVALSVMDDKLIIFKQNALYYLTGEGPDNTGNNNDFREPIYVSSSVGCDNPRSIVFTPSGLMFQSNKGIWMIGRDLSTSYIGAPIETYAATSRVVSAVNVPGTNQVRFLLDSGVTLMYDYYFQQWSTFTGIPATASVIYNDLHTLVNSQHQILQETPNKYLDAGHPVLMSFTTSWLNLGGLQGYERAYYFYLLGTFLTPHKLALSIAYDYNPSPTQQSIITPSNYTANWGAEQLWGSGGGWGGDGNLEQHRVFLQQQKCQAFQITLQEQFDPSAGTIAGAGLTLSGLNAIVGIKSGYPRLKASQSVG